MLAGGEALDFLKWYRRYAEHLMPVGGGLLDQTHYFLEAMSLIEAEFAKHGKAQRRLSDRH